jgi:hypothetical protein
MREAQRTPAGLADASRDSRQRRDREICSDGGTIHDDGAEVVEGHVLALAGAERNLRAHDTRPVTAFRKRAAVISHRPQAENASVVRFGGE